jgi:hypothetical protein
MLPVIWRYVIYGMVYDERFTVAACKRLRPEDFFRISHDANQAIRTRWYVHFPGPIDLFAGAPDRDILKKRESLWSKFPVRPKLDGSEESHALPSQAGQEIAYPVDESIDASTEPLNPITDRIVLSICRLFDATYEAHPGILGWLKRTRNQHEFELMWDLHDGHSGKDSLQKWRKM